VAVDVLVRFLNAFIMLALPLALGAFLARRFSLAWRWYFGGAAVFLASQLFHLPFNAWVLSPALSRLGLGEAEAGRGFASVAILFGFSAGLFEELARYISLRCCLREVRDARRGTMMGAGHGGMEAILLGFITLYALFQAIAYRGVELAAAVPADQLENSRLLLEDYWETGMFASLMGALERSFAIVLHIALTLFVVQAVRRRNIGWLMVAILVHSVANATALVIARSMGVYASEAWLGLLAIGAAGVIWRFWRAEGNGELTVRGAHPAPTMDEIKYPQGEVTVALIEDTRYTDGTT
jgi:uncharacterized membrane protein YhfC